MKAKKYIIPEVQILSYVTTTICATSDFEKPGDDPNFNVEAPARKLYV